VRILRGAGRALGGTARVTVRGLRVAVRPGEGQPAAWTVAVILSFIAFGTSGSVYDTAELGWALMPFVAAIAGLPFALVATRPAVGLLVSATSAFVLAQLPLVDDDPWPWLVVHGLVMLALLFATCVRENVRAAFGAWLLTATLFYWGVPEDIRSGWVSGVSVVAVLGLLLGRLRSANRALAVQEEVSSAEKSRRMVLEERTRIARDLHDIVAHHMSLIVVQTETAGYRVTDLSDSARAELLSIGETARSALAETRALLAVLRQDGQPVPDAPQPGLPQLLDLVATARRAGTRLDARLDADLERLSPGAALAVYRVAQEALANAARHAPGTKVTLVLGAAADGVRLQVTNEGVPGVPTEGFVAGHGVTGMRERAAAAGGALDLGPLEGGGFAVRLFVPVPEGASVPVGEAGR
jgi:signal transduction histidine kinase